MEQTVDLVVAVTVIDFLTVIERTEWDQQAPLDLP